jgi:glycosyl transferase, family 25
MGILDYFDRLAIIHLPEREDRFRALGRELSRIGIDINGSKVSIPDPPMPKTSNGYTSRGVYGSFLSHLEIVETAYQDGLDTVWVLEDDAIFSRKFNDLQIPFAKSLRANAWDMLFIGHSGWKGLPHSPTGLLRFSGPFVWAHCYAVHRRVMPRYIEYLRIRAPGWRQDVYRRLPVLLSSVEPRGDLSCELAVPVGSEGISQQSWFRQPLR